MAPMPYGAAGAIGDGVLPYAHREAQLGALGGGSVEVVRSIITQNDLGLPRLDRPAR